MNQKESEKPLLRFTLPPRNGTHILSTPTQGKEYLLYLKSESKLAPTTAVCLQQSYISYCCPSFVHLSPTCFKCFFNSNDSGSGRTGSTSALVGAITCTREDREGTTLELIAQEFLLHQGKSQEQEGTYTVLSYICEHIHNVPTYMRYTYTHVYMIHIHT